MRTRPAVVLALATLLASIGCARSVVPDDAAAAAYLARRPLPAAPAPATRAEAYWRQDALVAALAPQLGPRVGWKLAFTSTAVQRAFAVDAPASGALLAGMLLPDGATVPTDAGVALRWEPDLLVRVADPALADARTPLRAAAHLAQVIAFIELPDLQTEPPPSGLALIAADAGARWGVVGGATPVVASESFVQAMADLRVIAVDEASGTELATAHGDALLGHPFLAAAHLARDLRARGVTLRAGDLLSLGSFARPAAPHPGQRIVLRYDGLPGGPLTVRVAFR